MKESTILIVDDSEYQRDTLADFFRSEGFKTLTAYDGANALEIAKSTEYLSLVVSDYNMPNMDGLTFAAKFREIERFKNTPFMMSTSEMRKSFKESGKSIGINFWSVKPISNESLKAVSQKIKELEQKAS